MFELAVHAPFYNKINLLLNAHDDSFYTDYVNNHVLKARMDSIDKKPFCQLNMGEGKTQVIIPMIILKIKMASIFLPTEK